MPPKKTDRYDNMKRLIFRTILIISCITTYGGNALSQDVLWRVGLYNMFDNSEFAPSPIRTSRTMAGTRLQPMLGFVLESRHQLLVGTDLLHRWGSNRFIDRALPIAYYRFESPKWEFHIGAFPKQQLFERYPRMMFSDSVMWERPAVNGFSIEYKHNKSYANFWLDWTSFDDGVSLESFYLGWSGRWQKGIFYGQHFGYMFHSVIYDYTASSATPSGISVKENIKTISSLGADLTDRTPFDRLESNIGLSASLERNRLTGEYHTPIGLLWQTDMEYRGIAIGNTLYLGSSQQRMYNVFGNYLYWGDLMYKLPFYNRTDLTLHFYKSNILNISLEFSLHFGEGRLYNQQILRSSFNLNNLNGRKLDKSYRYLWDKL